jgi:hypothetical protein
MNTVRYTKLLHVLWPFQPRTSVGLVVRIVEESTNRCVSLYRVPSQQTTTNRLSPFQISSPPLRVRPGVANTAASKEVRHL